MSRADPNPGQTETRIFHYDLRGHLIAETNQSGQMLAEYVYLGDQPLAMIKPGESVYYFHNNHLGTPQALTNDSQAIVWKATYKPFGEAEVLTEAVENPHRFPGQYYDPETGLHYNYFRYYNPQTGRYITPDPIGLEGGINLFSYVRNNPVIFADPAGLVDEPGFWEGMIPVWGSGKQAWYDFEHGKWGWGAFNTALAISDVIPVRAAAGAAGKGLWKCGSHTWKATSKWLTKTGWREFKGQEMHHWLIPQGGWGRRIPDAIRNQPWNLMPMPNAAFHDALHGGGEYAMTFMERMWYGSPTSAKALGFSVGGRVLDAERD